jgi:hypothetical protein
MCASCARTCVVTGSGVPQSEAVRDGDAERQTKGTAMFIMISTLIWLAISLTFCLLGFLVGRCARRLPMIDSHLPWTMSRSSIPGPYHGRAPSLPDAAGWQAHPDQDSHAAAGSR